MKSLGRTPTWSLALPLLAAGCVISVRPKEPYPLTPDDPRERPVAEASPRSPDRADVERVLDDFHRAAAEADEARYFGHFARGAVFLGTDATERWTVEELRAYAEPFFSAGRGWTYAPLERHVYVADATAWFHERLWNEKYGECRGSGVLRRHAGTWKIAQYNLAFTIPNEVAPEVVERVRAAGGD